MTKLPVRGDRSFDRLPASGLCMRPNPVAVVNLPVPPVALAVDDTRYEPLSWISRAV
ncbi:MAG: hypothetical protein IPL57_00375 [Rubrivivax sp.]|nr:hypothetical protein [Rubrivivax sp.]